MPQSTKTIESVWAAKGNLNSSAIVSTADGKYPALDGSLITNINKTATFTLEPKRSASIAFDDLGFVAELSENAGNTHAVNGFPFDSTVGDISGAGTCNIAVWDLVAPEVNQGVPDKRYYWIPDTGGAATDLRFYESGSGVTPFEKTDNFLSPTQSVSLNYGANIITSKIRGDYYLPTFYTSFVKLAELSLIAGVTYELDYDILCFYANGGPSFNPEFVLASATAGMSMEILIEATNETLMMDDNTADVRFRSSWLTKSFSANTATNWNANFTQFQTAQPEIQGFQGGAIAVKYKVKTTLTCTESTTCDLRYYNASGGTGSLIDLLSFRMRVA